MVSYLGNLKFSLNTKDEIGWRVFFAGEYERETNHVLRCFCRTGDSILEAGANNGSETVLLASLVGPSGRVYAFEPIPHVRAQLETNVTLNAFQSIVTIEARALAESAGEVDFFVMPTAAPNQGMSSRYFFSESRGKVPVIQIKLDDWMRERGLTVLHFIKMDIQGGELGLLAGAKCTIKRLRPAVYLEATISEQRAAGHSMEELLDFFLARTYRVWAFRANRFDAIPLVSGASLVEGNWLAVPEERLAHLPSAARLFLKLER